ncbi:hypothetical protein [Brucella intermedia]|uniref:hypothetical protein n=1 Tax=Brucella intermedia TaxID=94625 RepID=UPI001592591B|nr:hypothetical protein [Brucella intermedia]
MHPSVQTTYNEVAKTLIGLTVKAEKPVRECTRQSRVMARAWATYNAWLAEHQNASARLRKIMFASELGHAHRFVRNQDNPVFITDEQSRFIGSDSRWR